MAWWRHLHRAKLLKIISARSSHTLLWRSRNITSQQRGCSERRSGSVPSISVSSLGRLHAGIVALRQVLDDHIVGHSSVKEALLLALLAQEHAYIEGPPGVAKTYIAELVSASAGLSHWFYQMHRDTRLNELIGEAIIVKDTTTAGEIIRQDVIQGGILDCELAVLDDISRAPGEALNVLLRILNERKYGSESSERIPLLSAIATGNPAQDNSYYAEPLDPATLDRFTIQLRVSGLVSQRSWESVKEVIDLYSAPRLASDIRRAQSIGTNVLLESGELVPLVNLGRSTKAVLVKFLKVLREDYKLDEENSLLTDRTCLVKAVKMLKANALLNGRLECEPEDLLVMRFLTAFRVPADIHERIEEIIRGILTNSVIGRPTEGGTLPDEESHSSDDEEDAGSKTMGAGGNDSDIEDDARDVPQRLHQQQHRLKEKTDDHNGCSDGDDLEPLLRALSGELEKGSIVQMEHPGGLPRGWSNLRSLSDVMDADPVEMALWCHESVPQLPRSQRRSRPRLGGQMAIIRDTSLSMMGPWNDFASLLCPKVVDLAKQNRMRVGYLEFNSAVQRFDSGAGDKKSFFSHDYAGLSSCMQWTQCRGNTNYEKALSLTLAEFQQSRQKNSMLRLDRKPRDQHILFITDGHPSEGDRTVQREIAAARSLGVAVHTIFIGYGECPTVLDEISDRTQGMRHVAQKIPGTFFVRVRERSRA